MRTQDAATGVLGGAAAPISAGTWGELGMRPRAFDRPCGAQSAGPCDHVASLALGGSRAWPAEGSIARVGAAPPYQVAPSANQMGAGLLRALVEARLRAQRGADELWWEEAFVPVVTGKGARLA